MSIASKRAKLAELTASTYSDLDAAKIEITTIRAKAAASRTANEKQDLAASLRYVKLAKLTLLALGLTRPEDDVAEK